jgi:hypothetical protein
MLFSGFARQIRQWFVTIVPTRDRFVTGDKPSQNTFQTMLNSSAQILESSDRAKTNILPPRNTDITSDPGLQGLVVMATTTEVTSRTSQTYNPTGTNPDRTVAVAPENLPDVGISDVTWPAYSANDPLTILKTTVNGHELNTLNLDSTKLATFVYNLTTATYSAYWGNAGTLVYLKSSFIPGPTTPTQLASSVPVYIGSAGTASLSPAPASQNSLRIEDFFLCGADPTNSTSAANYRVTVRDNGKAYNGVVLYNNFPFVQNGATGPDFLFDQNSGIGMNLNLQRFAPWVKICTSDPHDVVHSFAKFNNIQIDNTDPDGGGGSNTYAYSSTLTNYPLTPTAPGLMPVSGGIEWLPGTTATGNYCKGQILLPVPNYEAIGATCFDVGADIKEMVFKQFREGLPSGEVESQFGRSIISIQTNGGIKFHPINPFTSTGSAMATDNFISLTNLKSYRNCLFIDPTTHFSGSGGQGKASWKGYPLVYGHWTTGSPQYLEVLMINRGGLAQTINTALSTAIAALAPPTLTGTYSSDYANIQAYNTRVQTVLTALQTLLAQTNLIQ